MQPIAEAGQNVESTRGQPVLNCAHHSERSRGNANSMHARTRIIFQLLLAALGLPSATLGLQAEGISQDVYVWQRQSTPAVQRAVKEHGHDFREVVVLAGEVSWRDRQPKL